VSWAPIFWAISVESSWAPRKTSRRAKPLSIQNFAADFPEPRCKTRSARGQSRRPRMDGPWTWNFISSSCGMSGCASGNRHANGGSWPRWRTPASRRPSWW
jgi:hypothetical protein